MCGADTLLFFGVTMKRFLLSSACVLFVGLVCLSAQLKADITVSIGDEVSAYFAGHTAGTGDVSLKINFGTTLFPEL